MSYERNELAQMLLAAIKEAPHIWIDSQLGPKEVTIDGAVDLTAVSDRLLAAGYRKPRTITTLEDLDALPLGSVVIDAKGNVCEIDEWPVVNAHETFKGYIVTGGAEDWPLDRLALPATLLWEQS